MCNVTRRGLFIESQLYYSRVIPLPYAQRVPGIDYYVSIGNNNIPTGAYLFFHWDAFTYYFGCVQVIDRCLEGIVITLHAGWVIVTLGSDPADPDSVQPDHVHPTSSHHLMQVRDTFIYDTSI